MNFFSFQHCRVFSTSRAHAHIILTNMHFFSCTINNMLADYPGVIFVHLNLSEYHRASRRTFSGRSIYIIAITDTSFLTKMQRGRIAETILPLITRKHNLVKNGYGGDSRVAPVDCSTGALARSIRGRLSSVFFLSSFVVFPAIIHSPFFRTFVTLRGSTHSSISGISSTNTRTFFIAHLAPPMQKGGPFLTLLKFRPI